jgi:hypothetical protein
MTIAANTGLAAGERKSPNGETKMAYPGAL